MISKTDASGTTQYAWDFENRLTQMVTPSSGSATYKYDALGRRIQRTPSSGVSTNFVYDGQDVVKDINSDGTTVEYLNGPGIDNKIRQKGSSSSTTYYFSQDHLGSTTALTGTTGKLVERITYDAYGNSAGSTRTRHGYTGRERDPLTGLLYYRARFYDPQLGRFISEDPIALEGGLNPYAYVLNNPLNLTDALGLQSTKAQCAELLSSIIARADRLGYKLAKYDAVKDFYGNAPYNDGRSLTKPFSHYDSITASQKRLMKDINRYIRNCLRRRPKDCDKDDPPPPGVPEWVEERVTRPVERPHPGPSEMGPILRQGARWLIDHPTEAVAGTIVVIGGVTLIVTTGPGGVLVFALAP
jgi:RHS repeat-associated protein